MSSSIADNNDDVISSLPDTVLCHILAFLPTKHAIATSVLSKRWTHLWRSVLVINFGLDVCRFREEEKLIRFNDFLNYVLLSRDSSSIKSFRLHVSYHLHVSYNNGDNNNNNNNLDIIGFPSLVKWVEHVVKHNVESLDLYVYCNKGMPKLSNSVLTCRTLVVLNLNQFAVNGFSSVRLPSLKTLSICYSTLSSGRDFLLLLAGCPILEDLFVDTMKFYSKDSLNYQEECENLDLRRLNKARMPRTYCHFPLKALHNVREMHIELHEVYRRFDKIPIFHNLIVLKLGSINSNWYLLVQVLNHCPNVQTLQLCRDTEFDIQDYVQKEWVDPKLVPHCISLRLKTFRLWYVKSKSKLMLAKYILKNARHLQTMQIFGVRRMIVKAILSISPKASPTCKFIVRD